MRKSGFTKVIDTLLEDTGRVYAGASAGSIVAGPDIASANWSEAWDTNDVKLKDLKGMNLLDFVVIPHYNEKDKMIIEAKKKEVSYKVVGLEDGQVIFLRDAK
jgi:peptidase E